MSLLIDLLYPPVCYGCHHPGSYLCPHCLSRLSPNPYHPLASPSSLEGYLALFPYKSTLRRLILDYKYHFVTDVVDQITSLMATTLQTYFPHLLAYWQHQQTVLVPIPLHYFRRNWRGFNQSELIASRLSLALHLPYLSHLLFRQHFTSPQAQQARSHRLINISHAFALESPFPPASVILIDDVYTTGATLESAARILKSAGSLSITGLCFAG